jgi:hypothetical protein
LIGHWIGYKVLLSAPRPNRVCISVVVIIAVQAKPGFFIIGRNYTIAWRGRQGIFDYK